MSRYGNSVAEARPDLVDEWSSRNTTRPEQVRPASALKVWWIGKCGHEWEAGVDNRVYGNTGCPYCAKSGGRRLMPGVNDLQTLYPKLAKEWHPTKNTYGPSETLSGVKAKAWWLCQVCGREWEAAIKMRTSRGTGCPSCRGRRRGLEKSGATVDPWLRAEWSERNSMSLDDFAPGSRKLAWWVCKNGHEWKAAIGDRVTKRTSCKQCGNGGTSAGEKELADYVRSLGVEVRMHHRQIDSRYEYDITVPEKRIAIEYNGLYWHDEAHKGDRYHLDKTQAAEREGWSVIHAWEDDWRDRREIVERLIARKLGLSREIRHNARALSVGEVSGPDSSAFLNANHIQGATPGSKRFGLYDASGELLAVMVFRRRKGGAWELARYATSGVVRGGFSKLLKASIDDINPQRLITFSDRMHSSGELYERNGFVKDGELAPDYAYVVKGSRVHKFNYRVSRFRDDPNLTYIEGATERELASVNGLRRIYDAGKVRWVLVS